MAVSSDLKFVLFEILPTPALMAQGRELRIQNHLEMVHDCICALYAVIIDAQMRALKEPEVEEWVNDVGIAVADVEDLLRSILGWQPKGAAASNLLPCSFPEVASRHAILLEMEHKASRLNYLVRRGSSLCLRKEMMDSTYPRREEEEGEKEYFTILREEVVGRDKKVEKIINKIRRKQQQGSNNDDDDDDDDDDEDDDDDDDHDDDHDDVDDDGLCFFALWGQFMAGKTSVARMVYHHPWVCEHFDRRVWIDGSKLSSFDAMWVIKEFARWIAGAPCEDIWLSYDRFGGSHRYFIILDDFLIGLDDQDKLNQLEHFLLLVGEPGSIVMFIVDGSSYLGSRHSFLRYKIGKISIDNWKKLFIRHALNHHDPAGVEEENMLDSFVHRIHDQIGLYPVLAKMFGSIFRYIETSRWQEETDALCRTEQIQHNQHFNLMFLHYLSPIITRSCLYQLLIPQDYISGHADLLHVLAAEGIPNKEDMEITPSLERINSASERWYFRMRVGRDSTIPRQCLHLQLLVDSRTSAFPTTLSAKVNNKLRTLSLHREEEMVLKQQPCHITDISATMFANLIHLRILHLGDTRIQRLPHTVGKLLNLRYLNLSKSEIQVLPVSLCNLRNLRVLNLAWCEKLWRLPRRIHNLRSLQIMKLAFCARLQRLPESITGLANLQELDLEGCHDLIELPENFHNLRKLIYLNIIKCRSLTRMPDELEQMHDLQTLSGYSISIVSSIGDVISELQSLIGLEKLDLCNLQIVSKLKDASTPPMLLQDVVPKLKHLALHWKWDNMNDVEKASDVTSLQVLEGLQPNIYLSKLEIISYAGKEFPIWMNDVALFLYNLREIRLVNLRRCERLPLLGELVHLKIVEISGMDSITVVTFHTRYTRRIRRLDKLIFSEMPQLEKLEGPTRGSNVEWYIGELTLMQCPKFKTWEHYLWVSKLNIWLNNEMLWRCQSMGWQRLISDTRELTIVGCQELRCLPPVLRSNLRVSQLTIIRCNKLISLPDWLVEIGSLQSLFISGCPELTYIPPQLKTRPDLLLQHSGCPKLRF
ncbi:disease resistance protein RGA2-like [Musa acuminata AAA Group]|uniref:disease resistance protein RGA2-like n=1 Tax=Musa acuminata AAA Group TaxID=214697 RepID=UPI0031DCA1E1